MDAYGGIFSRHRKKNPHKGGDQPPCGDLSIKEKERWKMKKNHCMLIYYQADVKEVRGEILKKYYISKRSFANSFRLAENIGRRNL